MSFEADLKSHLQGSAALVALIADRIFPVIREEGSALPAVVYQVIANDPQPNLDAMDTSLRNIRVQLDCWSRAHSDLLTMFDAIRARMDTAASTFTSVAMSSVIDDYESDTRLYRRLLEFSCWYRAT
jgi:hypothetical protein